MFKLEKLLLAREGLIKIANSPKIPVAHAWELADFMDEGNAKFKQFDNIRQTIANDCKIENEDGTTGFDEKKYTKLLDELLDQDVHINASVLKQEKLKAVEGLTIVEIMAIKELME